MRMSLIAGVLNLMIMFYSVVLMNKWYGQFEAIVLLCFLIATIIRPRPPIIIGGKGNEVQK